MSHLFRLGQEPPDRKNEAGARYTATKKNFPILKGQSLYRLILQPHAVREPHWHANADELGYVVEGKLLITFYANGNERHSFTASQGETFFIPSGALHLVENVGKSASEIILQFSHEEPEDFSLLQTFSMFSDSVLGNTWQKPASFFSTWKRSKEESFAASVKELPHVPDEAHYSSFYRYTLEKSPSLVETVGGYAKVARKDVWPILKKQALYFLKLTATGMREPHWHPETAEMGYVLEGRGRMSILSPSGAVDTYTMEKGDLYFIPEAYPHHIENLSSDSPLALLVFFNNALPGDIGFTGSVRSLNEPALTATLKAPKDFFNQLPIYYNDLLIVEKTNNTIK